MRFKTRLKSSLFLIDLTPLVDVVFLMLIFFIITSDILPLKSLHIESARLNRDSAAQTTQLLLVMDAQSVIYVGSRKDIVDFSTLKDHLLQQIAHLKAHHPSVTPTLVLSVDRRVEYGSFLRLFSIAQECGTRIRLVFKPEDEKHSKYL